MLRPGIFMLVALAVCLSATESNAQLIRGRQTAVGAARFFAVRNSPGLQAGQFIRSGTRGFGGQGFATGNQGGLLRSGGGLSSARRLIQVGRIISRF